MKKNKKETLNFIKEESFALDFEQWIHEMQSPHAFSDIADFDEFVCSQIGKIRFGWMILKDENNLSGYSIEKKF